MLQVEIHASAGGFASALDFYAYPDQFLAFGRALVDFTGASNHEPTFEVGSTEQGSYCWLRLRAYSFDKLGHSALEISIRQNGSRQIQASSQFSGQLEVAAINKLGNEIIHWSSSGAEEMCFTPIDL